MAKQIFKFRIHTGQYDSDGELCLFWIGGRLVPDGADHVWVTTPNGDKILRCEKKDVEPVDDQEISKSLLIERDIVNRHRKSTQN